MCDQGGLGTCGRPLEFGFLFSLLMSPYGCHCSGLKDLFFLLPPLASTVKVQSSLNEEVRSFMLPSNSSLVVLLALEAANFLVRQFPLLVDIFLPDIFSPLKGPSYSFSGPPSPLNNPPLAFLLLNAKVFCGVFGARDPLPLVQRLLQASPRHAFRLNPDSSLAFFSRRFRSLPSYAPLPSFLERRGHGLRRGAPSGSFKREFLWLSSFLVMDLCMYSYLSSLLPVLS